MLTFEEFSSMKNDKCVFTYDDLPFFDYTQGILPSLELEYRIYKSLPVEVLAESIWGFNDTSFREGLFAHLLMQQLGKTPAEYYQSKVAKAYFKCNVIKPFDESKLP